MPYPPIVLDRAANLPLYRQIEVALRRSILDGRIGPGHVLPGIRAYAKHLGVAAVTVMTAYEQLTAEGYLEPRPGRGTLVAPGPAGPPGRAPATSLPGRAPAARTRPARRRRPVRGARSSAAPAREPRYDFRTGSTRLDLFPVGPLGAAPAPGVAGPRLRPRAGDDVSLAGGRPAPARRAGGLPRHVPGGPDDARAGRRDGRRAERLRDRGPAVAGRRADARARGPVEPAPPAHVRGPRASRRSTSRSTTAGCSSTACRTARPPCWSPRRGSTRTAARCPSRGGCSCSPGPPATRRSIIEDDCDSELRYEGHPQPSLQGLDEAGRVLYVGTFSKVLYPGLRIGYAVVPAPALEAVRRAPRGGVPGTGGARAAGARAVPRRGPLRAPPRAAAGALRRAPGRAARRARVGARDGRVSARPAAAGAHLVVRIEDVRLTATAARVARPGARGRGRAALVLPPPPGGRPGAPDPLRAPRPPEIRAGVRLLARAASRPRRATA